LTVVVITLVKDDLHGLMRTESSVLSQTTKVDWVIITPNDQSPTNAYAEELRNRGIASAVLADDGHGIYRAMNLAIKSAAASDWLWFMNAGDEFASRDSYSLVNAIASTTNQQWLFGGHYLGSISGKILGKVPAPQRFLVNKQLFSKEYISHQATIFRVAFLQKLGGFNESYKIAADWDLFVRASHIDQGYCIPEFLSIFYMGGLSTKSRAIGNRELLLLRKKYLPTKYLIKNYYWFFYRTIRNSVVILVENRAPNLADTIREIKFLGRNRR